MADKDDWNWKQWTRILVIVWGAAGILGGTNGYLSHPLQPIQPVPIVLHTGANEDARLRFFYLTDSLSTIKQRLNKSSPDLAVVAEIRSLTKRLDEIPDSPPWDAAMNHRLDTVINDWSMVDVQPKTKDASKREDIEQMENVVSKLVEKLHSLCKG